MLIDPFKIVKIIFSKDARDPLYIASANLIASIIGAVFWLILASITDASIYGEINYYIATASLFATFSLFGLNISSITQIAKGDKEFLLEALLLIIISSSIASIILALVLSNIILALVVIGLNIFALTIADILGNKHYKRYPKFFITNRGAQLTLSLSLYFVMGIEGVILGYALPTIILGSFIILKNKDIIRHRSLKRIRSKFKFIIHTYLFQISNSTLIFADKLILAPLFGFETLGLYQLAFQLLLFLAIIPASLIQYLQPQEASNVNRASVKKLGLMLAVIVAVIFSLASPMLINAFFPKYSEAIDAARIMAFGIIPMTLNAILNAELLGRERSIIAMVGSLVYMASLILSFFLLGNMFGLTGLALSTVLAAILQTIVLLVSKKR